jgi:hypothetical protein
MFTPRCEVHPWGPGMKSRMALQYTNDLLFRGSNNECGEVAQEVSRFDTVLAGITYEFQRALTEKYSNKSLLNYKWTVYDAEIEETDFLNEMKFLGWINVSEVITTKMDYIFL